MSKLGAEVKKVNYVTENLPGGWWRRIYLRTSGATAGRKDVVLISPEKVILRSNVEIERYAKSHKLKLDTKVYNVCVSSVDHVFKKESEELIAATVANKNISPVKARTNENKVVSTTSKTGQKARLSVGVLTESTPSNVIKKAKEVVKDDTPRKRGRPKGSFRPKLMARDRKSVRLSLAQKRRKSGEAQKSDSKKKYKAEHPKKVEMKAKKRRLSESAVKGDEKRVKSEETAPPVAPGRQTRNSLSSVEIPLLPLKPKKVLPEDDKLPKGWKLLVQKSGKKVLINVEDKIRIGSLRQLRNFVTKKSLKFNTQKLAVFFGNQSSDEEEDYEIESVVIPIPKDQGGSAKADEVHKNKDIIIISAEDANNCETENPVEKERIENDSETDNELDDNFDPRKVNGPLTADDYDVPLDDVEMSFQERTVSPLDPIGVQQTAEQLPEETPNTEPQVVVVPLIQEQEVEETVLGDTEEYTVKDEEVENAASGGSNEADNESIVKVVDSRDLDKIDLANFKFFVLPENDDDLPTEEHLPTSWNPSMSGGQIFIIPEGNEDIFADAIEKAVAAREKAETEETIPQADISNDIDESDDEQVPLPVENDEGISSRPEGNAVSTEIENGEQGKADSDVNEAAAGSAPKSPYCLMYEHPFVGQDPWRLVVAALIQANVPASVGSVLTLRFLSKFPNLSSLLELEDILSLPECEAVPKFPWLVKKMQKIAKRMAQGEELEEMQEEVGSYGIDVWRIFGLRQIDTQTKEYDLKAYLDWRQSCN